MPEEKPVPGWRKRFLANRMTFESILFEKELLVPGRENFKAGLAGALAMALFAALLPAQWVLRQGYFFSAADAAGFRTVFAWLEHFRVDGVWSLFKPLPAGFGAPMLPPLYYLTYVPVLKFITGSLNWALVLVNTFYISGLTLAVFTAIRKNRGNKPGWLGAGFALAMPFVLETARHPDHRLAAMALAAAVYACYINSEDFQYPVWNLWFGVFFGLGFFADTMFWVYMLPLAPFLLSGLTNNLAAGSILKGLAPSAALALPWYAFAVVPWTFKYFSGTAAAGGFRPGVWSYLVNLSSAAGLPLFLLGSAALLWMYFSVFMPYASRKIVAAWFWVPFAAVYFGPGAGPDYMYPAILPLAVAAAVLSTWRASIYLMFFCAFFMLADQSGLVGPVFMGRARVAGASKPSGAEYAAELMAALKPGAAGARCCKVALAGEDENFDHVRLNFYSAAAGRAELKFYVFQPGTMGLADFVVRKTPAPGRPEAGQTGAIPDQEDALTREISRPWFGKVFSRTTSFYLPDGAKLVLYAKNPSAGASFPERKYKIKNMDLGGLFMEEGSLTLSGFDPAGKVYAKAELFSPYATLAGFDIYGLNLEITDFSGLSDTGSVSDLKITGAGAVRVVSARTTNFSLERYLSGLYAGFEKLGVKLDGTARIRGVRKGREVRCELSLDARPPELALRLDDLTCGIYGLPGVMSGLFRFKYDLSALPFDVRFNRIKLKDQMLEVS